MIKFIKLLAALIFALLLNLYPSANACFAQDANKSFYDDDMNQDLSIWRLRNKQLTDEEKEELNKHVEGLNEARLKEQRAQTELVAAQTKLSNFVAGRAEKIEKEKTRLQDEIKQADRKVTRTQEKLDKEKAEAEALKKNFDGNLSKATEELDKQQRKIEEIVTNDQENLIAARENKKSIIQKTTEFQKAIEGKFTK